MCAIADYSVDHTININCDGLTLTTAYSNTLTIDANVSSIGIAIDATNFALENLVINTGANVSNTAGAKAIAYDSLVYEAITNDGTISAIQQSIFLGGGASLTTLSNTDNGIITSTTNASAIYLENSSTITTLSNSGAIQGNITINNSTISTLENSGTISGGVYGIFSTAGTINTLTNTGTINGSLYDIHSNATTTITTLNNDQGFSGTDALKYNGQLPTNYNIIINSTTDYGQVVFTNITGTTNFGIHSTSSVTNNTTYSSVVSGLSDAQLNNATSGNVTINGNTYNWTLTDADGNSVWDLNFGPGTTDTQNSIHNIKGQLQGNINAISAGTNFANMNTYDCNFFDTKGGCFSFGNRYTDVQSPSIQTNSFVATGGYKVNPHFRVAGFIDQNLNYNMASNIDVENKGPLMGAIVVWNQKADKLGWQLKVANAYQSKDMTIKRSVTGTSESGRGKTDIETNSYVVEASYNYLVTSNLLLRPYLAARYTLVKQDGYTETGVNNPLTYNTIRDRSKTLLLGMKLKYRFNEKLFGRASLGIEHDISHKIDDLKASGVTGLSAVKFENQIDKTRPVASLGGDYMISNDQRLSLSAFYQELPFTSTKSRTVYINYLMGF